MLPGSTTSAPARPRARVPARAELVGRASAATLTATRVPCPDPQGSLATLEAVLRATATGPRDPGLRALLLRQTLVARVVLAADPGHVASGPALDELVDELLALVADRRELADPLPGAEDYLRAEVVYAVTHEGARHLDDVLTRRTRISIETFDRGVAAAPMAAELMAGVLDWSKEQTSKEVEHYLLRVEAERASQEQPDDETADAARLGAPDVVPLSAS